MHIHRRPPCKPSKSIAILALHNIAYNYAKDITLNQFVDPALVTSTNPRRSFSLIAAKSYAHPLIGTIAKIQQSSK